ncbi:hypothetical protein GCM10025777_57350 [Membranihabitans marinus]
MTHCVSDRNTTYHLNISDHTYFKLPISNNINIGLTPLLLKNENIIYKQNEDIYFYNIKDSTTIRDTFLRQYDYLVSGSQIKGIYKEDIILASFDRILSYNWRNKTIHPFNLRVSDELKSNTSENLSFGFGFGTSNRTYTNFIPLVPWEKSDTNFKLGLYNGNEVSFISPKIPQNTLSLIYRSNKNLISPSMETDLTGEGVSLVFALSCRIFNIDHLGRVNEFIVEDDDCICGINEDNFVVATVSNYFPKEIPIYGNVFPDRYRNHYYQFFKSEWDPQLNKRKIYLRVMDENYKYLSKVEINWDQYNAQLLILPEAVFIQSNNAPDESHLYFYKIELNNNES